MTQKSRSHFVTGILIALLTIAVGYLAYSNVQMNHKLDALISGTRSSNTAVTDVKGAKNKSSSPSATSGGGNAFGKLFDKPLSPDEWDPFLEMENMQRRIDDIFGNAFQRFGTSERFKNLFEQSGFSPRMDLVEEDNRFVVRVNIPGSDMSQIDVSIEDNTLSVTATTTEDTTSSSKGTTLRRERRVGKFQRTIVLPKPVDPKSMNTQYKNGVLTITINKVK
ncbi:MAG: Hsp20 family protein [Candidatus Hydrogenedentes bacterium]|nr:Hsp20 family protein [Candidatus Hydrogenedentota bacterium]